MSYPCEMVEDGIVPAGSVNAYVGDQGQTCVVASDVWNVLYFYPPFAAQRRLVVLSVGRPQMARDVGSADFESDANRRVLQ
jgi:hypothetical protein